jgi:hypothetical protein
LCKNLEKKKPAAGSTAHHLMRRQTRLIMFKKLKKIVARLAVERLKHDEPPDESGDRDAGMPAPVKRGPPDRGSSVAVAEPDDDR